MAATEGDKRLANRSSRRVCATPTGHFPLVLEVCLCIEHCIRGYRAAWLCRRQDKRDSIAQPPSALELAASILLTRQSGMWLQQELVL